MKATKAKRVDTLLRVAATGPTNAGKTYSLLRLAYGVIKTQFPDLPENEIWEKIVVIDTERNRALFYAERDDLPLITGSFYHIALDAPYSAERYEDAITTAEETVGDKGVIIIDSLSHAWSYEGGILDVTRDITNNSKSKNSYTAWEKASPIHNNLINKILKSNCHTFVTMRTKMEYVLAEDDYGKIKPTKVGLKPIQREDVEYEFDITFAIDASHKASINKDTTILGKLVNDDGTLGVITEELGKILIEWSATGKSLDVFKKEQLASIKQEIIATIKKDPALEGMLKIMLDGRSFAELEEKELKTILKELKSNE